LADEAAEHEAELQRREAERNKRELQAIFKHACTVRRCLKFARMVLERFDVSISGFPGSSLCHVTGTCVIQRAVARAEARRRREEGVDNQEEEGEEKGEGEEENWEVVEPMEVLEGGGGSGGGDEEKFDELDRFSADNPSALRYTEGGGGACSEPHISISCCLQCSVVCAVPGQVC
jgi:hypothetical protein